MARPLFAAHTKADLPPELWEPLIDHLELVAGTTEEMDFGSARFAAKLGAEDWGLLAGLWHDLGKYASAFQDYLDRSASGDHVVRGSVDHSTAGAKLAIERFGHVGQLLAYVIAGHHAGLPDYIDGVGGRSGLKHRVEHAPPESLDAIARAPDDLKAYDRPSIPGLLRSLPSRCDAQGLRVAFFVRMLFSCLVDADFLATEYYIDPPRSDRRRADSVGPGPLIIALDSHLNRLTRDAPDSQVNTHRNALLRACRTASLEQQGLFTLTAPTGSGKTLSSLAFALMHANTHGMRRVIYALPYTSITEQIAHEFRKVFANLSNSSGREIVLEHHSSAAWKEADETDPDAFRAQLACENWDAEIIVTTNVQLLESMFAARASKCRKLHRIANSVIIFDEAQALPVDLMRPTLVAIDELSRAYNTSIVLCSATMPAIILRDDFPIGLADVREINPQPQTMSAALKRTRAHLIDELDDDELIERLFDLDQVLAVVNTRGHAAGLYHNLAEKRDGQEVWHLSAGMCPAHRTDVLEQIHRRLDSGQACRVISTQVIEAGVDVDFPVVYRAMAGLDSIVQAAGRCNRNGKQPSGDVFIFETDQAGREILRQAQTTREIVLCHEDIFSLEAIEHYFRLHLWQHKSDWDKYKIASKSMFDARSLVFQFREAARLYKVIKDQSIPVVVPYGEEGQSLTESLHNTEFPPRSIFRKLQRYTVSVPAWKHLELLESGVCMQVHEHTTVLNDPSQYDPATGLVFDTGNRNPERLVF